MIKSDEDQVEAEEGVRLEGEENSVQWLVRWGAMASSRFMNRW